MVVARHVFKVVELVDYTHVSAIFEKDFLIIIPFFNSLE
jgi:hypothetical protein